MRPRPRVLRLERAGEGRHRLHVRALQQLSLAPLDLQQMAKVACVEQQLLLRPGTSLLRGAERDPVEAAGQTVRDREKLQRTERLAQERVGAGTFRGGARSTG